LAPLTYISAKHHTLSQAVHAALLPSLSRATPPAPFPLVNGQTTNGFYFRWL